MDKLEKDILKASLEYLYWFSRFEFTLKAHSYLQSTKIKANALPNWDDFITNYKDKYIFSDTAQKLIDLNPQKQVIGTNKTLTWDDVKDSDNKLEEVISLIKAVRNNLFHGGKHLSENETQKQRNLDLIKLSTQIIIEIANTDDFGGETFYYPYKNFDLKKEIFLKE